MKMKTRLLAAAVVAALLPIAAFASTTSDASYDQGHAVLNQAWELEAQSIQMGYSSNARLSYLERAAEARQKALDHFESAIAADPENYQAHSMRGFVLRKMGRHEEALAAYEKALSINAEDATTMEYRGEAYVELGRYSDAKELYFDLAKRNEALANDLLAFMKMWLERPYPAQRELMETREYQELLSWVDERRSVQRKVAMLDGGSAKNWQ
jgi:tetratricopeptide (TPR) repeat protein